MRGFLGLLIAVSAWAQVLDRIAVVVGNTVITETEVTQETRLEAFLNQAPPDLTADARRTAAERLVDQQLIRNEIKIGAYPEPTAAEIDDMLRNLKQERFGGSDEQYRASLQKYGITEAQLRAHLAWQLSAIRFTDLRFSPAVAGIPGATPATPTGPDRAPAKGTGRTSDGGEAQSANRWSGGAAADVDQRLDAWLKQARAGTKVQFKKEAFQ